MQVHRVNLKTLVVVGDTCPFTLLHRQRLGCRETLAVEAESDRASIVQNHWFINGELKVSGNSCPAECLAIGDWIVTDRDRAKHSIDDLYLRVVMRVIHADGIVGSHELIGEGFAWLDEVLGIRGDAILIVGRMHTVPVDIGAEGQVVEKPDLDFVVSVELDLGCGHDFVVGPGLHELARFHFPIDDR